MNLGINIKNARKQKGLTQEELAENVGITQVMIHYIEQGLKIPSVGVLAAIAKELDVSVDSLLATA